MPKYALDTSVYIDAFRSEGKAAELKEFLAAFLPFTYLNAVVIMELRAGARTRRKADAIEGSVITPFARRRRVFAPSAGAFQECGRILAEVAADGLTVNSRQSLVCDVLLAASCKEAGVTLITRDADFRVIARRLKGFGFVKPFP